MITVTVMEMTEKTTGHPRMDRCPALARDFIGGAVALLVRGGAVRFVVDCPVAVVFAPVPVNEVNGGVVTGRPVEVEVVRGLEFGRIFTTVRSATKAFAGTWAWVPINGNSRSRATNA